MDDLRAQLMQRREAQYAQQDRDLLLDIGFFVSRFAYAELALTHMVGVFMGQRDPALTEIAFYRVTAGTKAELFKKLAKKLGGIGPNFLPQWTKFESKAIPLRNTVAHSMFVIANNAEYPTYLASNLGSLPWSAMEMDFAGSTRDPEEIEGLELFNCGCWLQDFALSLMQLGRRFTATGIIDLEHPNVSDAA